MDDAVIADLIAWGASQRDIRAILLTSTRATGAPTDRYSDYDVVLLCTEVAARYTQRDWISAFGEVVIAWWDPLQPDPDIGLPSTGNIVYYTGTRKIDFALWPIEAAARVAETLPAELDAGYVVLLDKDDLTGNWPQPTGRAYAISLPDCAGYRDAVNDFLIGVPYIATAMIRGNSMAGKWVLDVDMRYEYLLPMLQWYAAVMHGPDVRIGGNGKGIEKVLPADTLQRLERTHVGLDAHANLTAMNEMIALFRDTALEVGAAVGCDYPQDLHDRVVMHTSALVTDAGLDQASSNANSSST